jgi:PAS domain S-box-containing protein
MPQRGRSEQPAKGRRARPKARKVSATALSVADLQKQVGTLTRELKEARQQQAATADVLKVISQSTFDLQTALDALVESAVRLCDAETAQIALPNEAGLFQIQAHYGFTAEFKDEIDRISFKPGRESLISRALLERATVQIRDVQSDPEYELSELQRLGGYRSMIATPLLRSGIPIGVFGLARHSVRPFTDNQMALLATFVDQAVIAIENARLVGELRERTAELACSVDELTATSDVLKIISRSSVELETVLDTLVETVTRLCRADQALMWRRQDDKYQMVAMRGLSAEAMRFTVAHPFPLDRSNAAGRAMLERRAVHVPDVLRDPEYRYGGAQLAGARTLLGIPLLREDALIGIFVVIRTHVDPFTPKEIELATTFADQAVIAMENARLLDELRQRQAELRVTFDNMGDGVAMFDADTHLAAWNRNLQEMLDLPDAVLTKRPSSAELFRYLAARGEFESADLEAVLRRSLEDTSREMRFERTRPDGRVIEVRRNPVPGGGFVLIYGDITERKRAEETIRAARDAAEKALRELQTAQASLVHAQKMAALGQLTAGHRARNQEPTQFRQQLCRSLGRAVSRTQRISGPDDRTPTFQQTGGDCRDDRNADGESKENRRARSSR